jgi:cytochrome c oxidase assembly protein subunit 15
VLARLRTPETVARVALVALTALTLIVLTGAIVRLSGSGLGCPDWPKCFGKTLPPLKVPALIEYGNRVITGFVSLAVLAAAVLAFLRRPYRRDIAVAAVLLPLGVAAQIVLGGFTVREHLAPGYVMAHFSLSMIILAAAVTLVWRTRHDPAARPRTADRAVVWSVRALVPLGGLAIFAGTAASGAGPHAGGQTGEKVHRLYFKGADTLSYVVHRHAGVATLLGLVAVGAWVLARQREADPAVRRALSAVVVLLAVQGVLGGAQYALKLPAEMVWTHVLTAALTWLAILWATAAAGRLEPQRAPARSEALRPKAAA